MRTNKINVVLSLNKTSYPATAVSLNQHIAEEMTINGYSGGNKASEATGGWEFCFDGPFPTADYYTDTVLGKGKSRPKK